MQTFTGEAVGGCEDEIQDSWEVDRLQNPLGCAGLLVYGLVGMAVSCAVFVGILNALRIAGR